jgi:hypothetical protein
MTSIYKGSDYKKLLEELFSGVDPKKCNLTVKFIQDNQSLLKKKVGANNYGIPQGSTALHILAINEFSYMLVSGYRAKTFFRSLYDDVNSVINCIHDSMDDEDLFNNLRKLNILDKKDENGKTSTEIIADNLENSINDKTTYEKFIKLKAIVDKIGLKQEEVPADDIIRIEIEKEYIISETTKNNKKIIRVRKMKDKKPYRVILFRATKKPTVKKNSGSLRKTKKKTSL